MSLPVTPDDVVDHIERGGCGHGRGSTFDDCPIVHLCEVVREASDVLDQLEMMGAYAGEIDFEDGQRDAFQRLDARLRIQGWRAP